MVRLFLKAVEQQAIKNLEIAEKIKNLYEEMKQIFTEKLSSKWAINALDYIFTNPILETTTLLQKWNCSCYRTTIFRILLEENLITTLKRPQEDVLPYILLSH